MARLKGGNLRLKVNLRKAAASGSALLLVGLASPAQAQELTFGFTNPSFGGNPFYSAHLLGVATAQRPERPSTGAGPLTPEQLFARQLQSRLLSALSAGLVQAITGSAPGDSGEFQLGDQRIFFERTDTEIRVRIFNELTGETTEIVVPVFAPRPRSGAVGLSSSAENVLSGSPSSAGVAPIEGGSLDGPPIEQLSGSGF